MNIYWPQVNKMWSVTSRSKTTLKSNNNINHNNVTKTTTTTTSTTKLSSLGVSDKHTLTTTKYDMISKISRATTTT